MTGLLKMANIFYPSKSTNFGKVAPYNLYENINTIKIGDKVKVIENDEGFKKTGLHNQRDFELYRNSIGNEYKITGVINLKEGTFVTLDYSMSLSPVCIFEKIGEVEQKNKACVCDITLLMAQGCKCNGK